MTDKGKKTDRRIVRSRAALRHALLTLMADKPFKAISITEIVELANYNRGTFYSNYESKDALLDDIISDLIEKLLLSFRAPYEKVEFFHVDQLKAHSVMLFEHIYVHSAIYTVFMKSDMLMALREKMFIALKKISTEELVYTRKDIDEELLIIYSLNALLGLIFHWVESGFKHSPAYMQEQLVKIINYHPTVAKTAIKGSSLS
ncbi:TetR/AcrR family transcriptional regulator [Paenibacillus alginolyticus]|uniref:TetR/AcrR family transcriptional regulator n=1 Tax=Paenibacillus alginolyticus TaxID=59839 RepID=A0ABT4GFI7_9BACL|nr:TetR/AcrR family transcriptional regulator [Paenibacillus alginolyticus]MCY9666249.1 TetR/AcrR family transcriptional regulator [Paenibacillus alginolyticus]MCY9694945.1 TetR/AcrR family transcriptional regulator [Paenibacillus alginolyticus]MEC0143047.1 TetR/AcrR family transcriptional regulator [Paenibacillus alginolyticus]